VAIELLAGVELNQAQLLRLIHVQLDILAVRDEPMIDEYLRAATHVEGRVGCQ
jgi:uncharacterized protein YlaN (UPF0358 family)